MIGHTKTYNLRQVIITVLLTALICISATATYYGFASPNGGLETIIDFPSLAKGASYIISKVDSTIYAINGLTGAIDYSGTDAATVIQSALDALTSGRTWKEKVVLKGDFEISDTIKVPSYTILEIMGTLKAKNSLNANIIENKDPAAGDREIVIIGANINGNKVNQASGHGIRFVNTNRFRLYDLFLKDVKENGIYIDTDGGECEDFVIACSDFWGIDEKAILLEGGMTHDGTIIGNHMEKVRFGIYLQDSRSHAIVGNAISTDVSTALYGGITLAGTSQLNSVIGNQIDNCWDDGIYMGSLSENNMIAFNEITDITDEPIHDDGTNNIKKYNVGFVTENSGTATVANNEYIAHGIDSSLNIGPTNSIVLVTPYTTVYDGVPVVVGCSAVNGTHIQISAYWTNGTAITDDTIDIWWSVEYG